MDVEKGRGDSKCMGWVSSERQAPENSELIIERDDYGLSVGYFWKGEYRTLNAHRRVNCVRWMEIVR